VIKERGLHALQVTEDLAAKIEHDLLAGPLHHVGLRKFEYVGKKQCTEVEAADLGNAGHGSRAKMAREPGELGRWRIGHVGVDRDLYQVGTHHVGGSFEKDGESGEPGLQFVGFEISKETAHQASVVGLAGDFIVRRWLFRGLFLLILRFLVVCHRQSLF